MQDDLGTAAPKEPARSRAVFSTDDFRLLRAAVGHYLKLPEIKQGPDGHKYSSLYHRLGRLD